MALILHHTLLSTSYITLSLIHGMFLVTDTLINKLPTLTFQQKAKKMSVYMFSLFNHFTRAFQQSGDVVHCGFEIICKSPSYLYVAKYSYFNGFYL